MKSRFCLCVALGISLNALGAGSPDADAKAIQGAWQAVRADLAGLPMPDALTKTISLKLDHGKYAVLAGGTRDNGAYTLDATITPKSMNITGGEGPNHGKTFLVIYELKDDTLRVCYDLSGATRPTEFKTTPGTRLYLVTYHRKKE
jgi:uncharacterized protein (TIGR03067 family)